MILPLGWRPGPIGQGERGVIIAVSLVVVIWMVLLAARFLVIPFDDVRDSEHPHSDEPVTMSIGFMESVDSLNPNIAFNNPSFFLFSMIYDCLTTYDDNMNPTGNLATSWWMVPEDDPDMIASGEPYGSVWEYNLTHNAKWHDGVQFTADDVAFTINLYKGYFDEPWAYSPYIDFIEEAEMVDNYTVRIHFSNPDTDDPMPVPWGYSIPVHILPKHLVEQLPLMYSYMTWNWTGVYDNETSPNWPIVGTGPWVITPNIWQEWLTGDHITLVRNPNYHWKLDKPGAPEISIDKVNLRFFQDSTSMVLALKNLELDVAEFPKTAYHAMHDDVQEGSLKNVTCFSGPSCSQGFVYLSYWMETGGPDDARLDPVVRRAMALAIDKNPIVQGTFLGLAEPGSTIIPPINSDWHYEPTPTEAIPFNATAAEELLESNGYIDIDSDGIRECTIASYAVQMGWEVEGTDLDFEVPVSKYRPEGKDIAMYIKNEWNEIGLNTSIQVIEDTVWPTLCPLQMDVSVSWWDGVDPDPQYLLYTQSDYAIDGWSDTGFSNASYTENFTKSASTLDVNLRKTYVDSCQRILYDQCPYIVLAYPHSCYAWRDDGLDGWGNWSSDPGRSLDAVWGANPLFFDLHAHWSNIAYADDSGLVSSALNVIIIIAAVGTAVLLYFVLRGRTTTIPPGGTK